MQTFIGFLDYTEKEMQQMNAIAERRGLGKQMVESQGGELHDIYYTLGSYDAIIIASFPDADAAAKTSFVHDQELGGELETIAAYTGEEFDELVEELDETPESGESAGVSATTTHTTDSDLQRFIGLLNYTENEMQQMNQMAESRNQTDEMAESVGGEIVEIYYTLGEHDIVMVMKFPDAESAAQTAFVHNQEMGGELEVVPAFNGQEFDELVEPFDETD